MFYIDSNSARQALIRGSSPCWSSQLLLLVNSAIGAQSRMSAWFSRVPGYCNPADEPSRLRFDSLLARGAERALVDWAALDWQDAVGPDFWPPRSAVCV